MRKNTVVTECSVCHGNDKECDECDGTGIIEICMTCNEVVYDNECGCE
jgi:hypothetical protein